MASVNGKVEVLDQAGRSLYAVYKILEDMAKSERQQAKRANTNESDETMGGPIKAQAMQIENQIQFREEMSAGPNIAAVYRKSLNMHDNEYVIDIDANSCDYRCANNSEHVRPSNCWYIRAMHRAEAADMPHLFK